MAPQRRFSLAIPPRSPAGSRMQLDTNKRGNSSRRRSTSVLPNQREKERGELAEAQSQVKQLTEQLENEKARGKETMERLQNTARRRDELQQQMERSQANAEKLRMENRARQEKIDRLERHSSQLEDRLRTVESRATEVEKLELMLETLRNRLENSQSETREKEHELRQSRELLAETTTKLQAAETQITCLTDRVADLKAQVREELSRNEQMERRLDELEILRDQLKEKNSKMAAMEAEMEQKTAVLTHARMTMRDEREKIKALKAQVEQKASLHEELALARAEALTLKRLLIGKDTLVVQKTQALDLAKELIRELDKGGRAGAAMKHLDQPRALYPYGANFNDPDKKQCLKDGSVEDFDKLQKQFHPDPRPVRKGSKFKTNTSKPADDSGTDYVANQQTDTLLEAILREDAQERGQSNPGDYGGHGPNHADPLNNQETIRRPKTAVVKPQNYHASQTFSNFRTAPDPTTIAGPAANKLTVGPSEADVRRQMRLRLLRRGESQPFGRTRPRASSATAVVDPRWATAYTAGNGVGGGGESAIRRSSGTAASTTRPGSSISKLSETSSTWGDEQLSVYDRDHLATKFVHLGDRVVIDLATKKGEKEKLATGVARYIGEIDKEVEDFRIYIGVKMDEPVGDMDGVYKGKKYFTVPPKHGKLVKISKVKAVLNTKASTFRSLADCIENYVSLSNSACSTSSISTKSRTS